MIKTIKITAALLLALVFSGCSDNKQQEMIQQAVAIEAGDECHLCGMIIQGFPGPKGEATRKETPTLVKKFCSTRDLFSYYLDPENKRNVEQLFVHDMSKAPWDEPNDGHFIDGRSAWYVVGSDKFGAMGSTLGSFSKQEDAMAFSKEFGGEVLAFDQLTLAHLQ